VERSCQGFRKFRRSRELTGFSCHTEFRRVRAIDGLSYECCVLPSDLSHSSVQDPRGPALPTVRAERRDIFGEPDVKRSSRGIRR
jgi:hypothetical protein